MVSDRARRWATIAGQATGSVAIWLAILLALAWLVFGLGIPALVFLAAVSVPPAQRSPDYEGTFEMGAFLMAATVTATALPIALLLLLVGAIVGYLTPAPLYLGPLRYVGYGGRYIWRGVRDRITG